MTQLRIRLDGREYDGHIDHLDIEEAEAIEQVTGLSFGDWQDAMRSRSARALRAFIWVLRRRDEPALRYNDVRFRMDALDYVLLDDEGNPVKSEQQAASGKDEAPSSGGDEASEPSETPIGSPS